MFSQSCSTDGVAQILRQSCHNKYARSNPKIKEEHLRKNSASLGVQEKYNVKEKENLMDWLKKLL